MADPYAQRAERRAGTGPGGQPPWLDAVAGRLRLLGSPAADGGAKAAGAALAFGDQCVLPALMRVDAVQAEMLLRCDGRSAPGALEGVDPIYAIKHGTVAGPPGEPGAREVDAALVTSALDCVLGGEVEWERDPDFGFEVIASCPGLAAQDQLALMPRLLYATQDRVYEHAELVAETKRVWHERLSALDGVRDEVLAATGWPIDPTGQSWKD